MSRPRTSLTTQFHRHHDVTPLTHCWPWLGPLTKDGYGTFTPYQDGASTRTRLAHRWAYEHFIGPVPAGMVLDHLCRTRGCVNPEHLEPVTQAENVHRGAAYTKTACKRGHEYTPENTGRTAKGRYCKACKALLARQRKSSALLPDSTVGAA